MMLLSHGTTLSCDSFVILPLLSNLSRFYWRVAGIWIVIMRLESMMRVYPSMDGQKRIING